MNKNSTNEQQQIKEVIRKSSKTERVLKATHICQQQSASVLFQDPTTLKLPQTSKREMQNT